MKKSQQKEKDAERKEFKIERLEKLKQKPMHERIRIYRAIPERLKRLIFEDFKLKHRHKTTSHDSCTLVKMKGLHDLDGFDS